MISATITDKQPLTERQCNIIKFLMQGCNRKEIGEKLYLSLPTVKHDIGQMLAKYGCINATQLVAHALINNLI